MAIYCILIAFRKLTVIPLILLWTWIDTSLTKKRVSMKWNQQQPECPSIDHWFTDKYVANAAVTNEVPQAEGKCPMKEREGVLAKQVI